MSPDLIHVQADAVLRQADFDMDALTAACGELFQSPSFVRAFAAAVLIQRRRGAQPDLDGLNREAQTASSALADSLGEAGLRRFLGRLVTGAAAQGKVNVVRAAVEEATKGGGDLGAD